MMLEKVYLGFSSFFKAVSSYFAHIYPYWHTSGDHTIATNTNQPNNSSFIKLSSLIFSAL